MTPRIAMVCSGLGRVRRGNETWARTVAAELHAAGVNVRLIGGGPLQTDCPYVRLRNVPREAPLLRRCLSWHHRYLLEQVSFGAALQRHLRREPFDIVHVADPALALRLHRQAARLKTRVVYKDGLLLGPPWCRKFDFVQVLAPYYRETAATADVDVERWFAIPHLVDVRSFAPAPDRLAPRRHLLGEAVPEDAFVVLAVGDFSPASSKRLDWIVQEAARLSPPSKMRVVFVGQSGRSDQREFEQRARVSLGERVRVAANVEPNDMRSFYQSADIFVHAALREPFGIVFLEALACGLPIVAHTYPVTQWIIGDAGQVVDMTMPGELGRVLTGWQGDPALRAELGRRARARAESAFAPEKIIPLYQEMYQRVLTPAP